MIQYLHMLLLFTGSMLINVISYAAGPDAPYEKSMLRNDPFLIENSFDQDPNAEEDSKITLSISRGILTIHYAKIFELADGEAVIYNLLGQEIIRKKLEISTENQISMPAQNTCYLVVIKYSKKVYTKKIMVSAE